MTSSLVVNSFDGSLQLSRCVVEACVIALYGSIKPLSHRDSGKYMVNVFRHLFPDRQICCIHTASDFPEYVRAFTHNP